MESLQGYFLIATPKMMDPRFEERVVYICVHNDEGAMGLVINQPIPDITLADILRNANMPVPSQPLPPVYLGGPVETNSAFFLYTADYEAKSYIEVTNSVRLSRDAELLHDLSQGEGPASVIPALGYSGWAPGQLEYELSADGWLTLPGKDEIVFNTPDKLKWKKAAQSYGIDIELYGDVSGSA